MPACTMSDERGEERETGEWREKHMRAQLTVDIVFTQQMLTQY